LKYLLYISIINIVFCCTFYLVLIKFDYIMRRKMQKLNRGL